VIEADDFLKPAAARGFDFFTGVPCSFLTPLIDRVIGDLKLTYIGAASEGEAVAIAAGAWLGGRKTVVMCQNSGLGNAVNPLTSLNHPFRIPTLLIVTWRGEPGLKDEPQHEVMGQITSRLLDLMGIRHREFPVIEADIGPALNEAEAHMAAGLPFALIMRKDSVRPRGLNQAEPTLKPRGQRRDFGETVAPAARPMRREALARFLELIPDRAAVIATTGKCARELFTLTDRPQHFYQVGSMGGASALGLGLALNVKRPVVVLDGDGAALMKLGNLATIGAFAPTNLVHIVLDNGVHDSTGGQQTVSATVDFADLALAAGYRLAARSDGLEGFADGLRWALAAEGPVLLHQKIRPGSEPLLGRPSVPPDQVARRFKDFVLNPL
jgi:phosphonopyruvate decarboxylase